MQLDTGVNGAKRQSYVGKSPRAILKDVVEGYPNDSKAKLFEIFFEKLMEANDEGLYQAIAEYWFAGEYKNLTRNSPASATSSRPSLGRAVEGVKARLQEHIDRRVQIVLSEMLMPSGVRLRDCSKEECERAGGWFTKLAAQMRGDQRVGEVFGEDQLRDLYLGQ